MEGTFTPTPRSRSFSSTGFPSTGSSSRQPCGPSPRSKRALSVDRSSRREIRSELYQLAVEQNLITDQNAQKNRQVRMSVKDVLAKAGSTGLSLTKYQEQGIMVARRKIMNQISAREGRRREKQYAEALERMKEQFHNENVVLKTNLQTLEQNNRDMKMQLEMAQRSLNDVSSNGGCACDAYDMLSL